MADKYSDKDRQDMAGNEAMDDGAYPIKDQEDLAKAIKAVGRGSADHDKIRKHIMGRAKALNLMSLIPDNWNADGSLSDAKAAAPLEVRRKRAEGMQGTREVRRVESSKLEVRDADADGRLVISGLASRTATPYEVGSFQETIARGAFGETLKRNPDVQLLVNHEGLPIARTTIPAGQPGSLTLRETNDGLTFDAVCDPSDPDVARVASKIRSGLMDQCSFAFRVIRQQWGWMEDTGLDHDTREIQELSLDRGDVSVVNYGANPATNVTARGADELELRDDGPAMGNPGCGCCPDCKGWADSVNPAMQTNSAECCGAETAEDGSLDVYRARLHVLKLKGK